MVNVAVIGAGGIGRRHMEAIVKLQEPINLFAVDPSDASLAVTRELMGQLPQSKTHSVHYLKDIKELTNPLDVAIVATNSDVRLEITQRLLSQQPVGLLVLEKFLFQSEKEFNDCESLVEVKGVPTVVNHPRRMWDFYLKMGEEIKGKGPVHLVVKGSQLGLGCNGIHYLDLLGLLTGRTDFEVSTKGLYPEILASKRAGFVEMNGVLVAQSPRGDTMVINSGFGAGPSHVEIATPDTIWSIDEAQRSFVKRSRPQMEVVADGFFDAPFQSAMSHKLVENWVKNRICTLTPYKESKPLHLSLLKPFARFVSQHTNKEMDRCPIT